MQWKIAGYLSPIILPGLMGLAACQRDTSSTSPAGSEAIVPRYAKAGAPGKKLVLQSRSFTEGGVLPQAFTCNGENVSPPLSWTGVPQSAKSLALLCVDPDAPGGTWVHWVVYNLPANIKGLPQNVPPNPKSHFEGLQGINDFKALGYGGACPPQGSGTHRYVFRLYALDTTFTLKSGTSSELLQAMDGHVLAQGQLMAKYAHP